MWARTACPHFFAHTSETCRYSSALNTEAACLHRMLCFSHNLWIIGLSWCSPESHRIIKFFTWSSPPWSLSRPTRNRWRWWPKWLYLAVAKRHQTNWRQVERSLRIVVRVAWGTNRDFLQKLSLLPVRKRPTVSQFMSILWNTNVWYEVHYQTHSDKSREQFLPTVIPSPPRSSTLYRTAIYNNAELCLFFLFH